MNGIILGTRWGRRRRGCGVLAQSSIQMELVFYTSPLVFGLASLRMMIGFFSLNSAQVIHGDASRIRWSPAVWSVFFMNQISIGFWQRWGTQNFIATGIGFYFFEYHADPFISALRTSNVSVGGAALRQFLHSWWLCAVALQWSPYRSLGQGLCLAISIYCTLFSSTAYRWKFSASGYLPPCKVCCFLASHGHCKIDWWLWDAAGSTKVGSQIELLPGWLRKAMRRLWTALRTQNHGAKNTDRTGRISTLHDCAAMLSWGVLSFCSDRSTQPIFQVFIQKQRCCHGGIDRILCLSAVCYVLEIITAGAQRTWKRRPPSIVSITLTGKNDGDIAGKILVWMASGITWLVWSGKASYCWVVS